MKPTVNAQIPPHVEYSLTKKGHEILPVIAALHQVGSQWPREVCICPLNPNIWLHPAHLCDRTALQTLAAINSVEALRNPAVNED
ncbi:winged helix-turn-helix transcriptional regulator [Kovacikia minuta]|uniref:winged helix-turn-helix transcriptional regulator n=1 Tax=Kovacikia minuta TaxID=2931930 RepID=UPI0028F44B46|nr:winged helix-turn-helix transcriptional regulator [Kovacikia minuta]